MKRHFIRDLEQLMRDVLGMGGLAQSAVDSATRAFLDGDAENAQRVVEGDLAINDLELEIEEDVLKLLALYTPRAGDLRAVVGAIKTTNELERVGDLSVNIAERTHPGSTAAGSGLSEIERMATQASEMLKLSLDAFIQQDEEIAFRVLALDDDVDALLEKVHQHQTAKMANGEGDFATALDILSIAKHLERIADHATNIAEDVIYTVSGEVVKHQHAAALLRHSLG